MKMKTNENNFVNTITKEERRYSFFEKIASLGESKAFVIPVAIAVITTILWFLTYTFVELTWTEFDWVFKICNLGIFSETALTAGLAFAGTIASALLLVYAIAPTEMDKMDDYYNDECTTLRDKLYRFIIKNDIKLFSFFVFSTSLIWFLTAMVAFYDAFPNWMFSDVALAILVAPITVCILSAIFVPLTVHIINAVKKPSCKTS